MSDQLDENALRRDTFSDGHKVTLGDGQEWTFPEAKPEMFPRVDEAGKVAAMWSLGYGRDHRFRLDDLAEAEGAAQRITIQMELAAALLLRNYSLDARALGRLLRLDDETDEAMWPAIANVLFGLPPGPVDVGEAASPEPVPTTEG